MTATILSVLGICLSVLAIARTRRRGREFRRLRRGLADLRRQHEEAVELAFRCGYLRGARDAANGLAWTGWVARAQERWREHEKAVRG